MLIALIANLQNVPQPVQQLPTVKIDRGGGGPSWSGYEIMDIIAATAAFTEIPGEDPVARAVRRHKWIGHALPFVKEAREKREAAAFLAGAQLAEVVVEKRHAVQDQLKIEQIVEIIDAVRAEAQPPVAPKVPAVVHRGHRRRGGEIGMLGPALLFGGIGLAIGIALTRSGRSRYR